MSEAAKSPELLKAELDLKLAEIKAKEFEIALKELDLKKALDEADTRLLDREYARHLKEHQKKDREIATLKAQAELDIKLAELTSGRVIADKVEFDHLEELAVRKRHREFTFSAPIDYETVDTFVDWIRNSVHMHPKQSLTVYMNSPGGSVYDGFVAMEAIREAEAAGNEVTVKINGMAASMAGIIAQAASRRLIGKHAWLMIHTVASFDFGFYKTFEISDKDEYLRRLTKQAVKAYADRTDKWTVETLFEKVHGGRKDWWLTAEEALAEGFVDEIF